MAMRSETTQRLTTMVAVVACLLVGGTWTAGAVAQAAERFSDRLSRLPVDRATTASISGHGTVTATLEGDQLTITAVFEGMSSAATAAHIHRGPRARPGPVAFSLDVPSAESGTLTETITLDGAQRDALRRGLYYLQIHTTDNPGGELRGWLLPD